MAIQRLNKHHIEPGLPMVSVAGTTERVPSLVAYKSASRVPAGPDRNITEPIKAPPIAADSTGQPMQKWRLNVLVLGYLLPARFLQFTYLLSSLCISLLMSTLETTIVSTALVSITNELNGFSQRDWIVTSYLLTYTG